MALIKKHAVALAIAAVAIFIAWLFCATTLSHTRPMGLPLDDSYIYLTYAKQFGRAQPFSYYPGGGYSAGSTSLIWPMLLAPFWTLGARGHALVWVSFGMCAALYALTAVGLYRLGRRLHGEVAGIAAAVIALSIAPFAWTSLSGMEVALASALLVAILLLLLRDGERPSRLLMLCLAAASLSRPEATLLVVAIVAVRVRHDRRWLIPLAAPTLWLLANKLFAGNLFPNTGVAKSHFYLPGFDWTYWFDTILTQSGKLLVALFWKGDSPLVVPQLFAAAWLFGAWRIVQWARREQQLLVGVLILVGPFVLCLAVIASSGLWSFQNYRYIAPAFPLFALGAGMAFGTHDRRVMPGVGVALLGLAIVAEPGLRTNARLFAQGAMDTNTQVVAIGDYIARKLPDAKIMFHDAGAIAYYGDGEVYDMLGLVTNHQAGIANNGAGARFEFLEELPPDQRPTHFAYYPGWLGQGEMYGDVLLRTPLRPGFETPRFAGDADMQVIVASWDHVGTGERPLTPHDGWALVDRVDIASMASEKAHRWVGALGRRSFGDPTARWSIVGREVGAAGLVLDGGRTIRGGREAFDLALDPARPARLILRSGGAASYPFHETIDHRVEVNVFDQDERLLGTLALPAPRGGFVEVELAIPAGVTRVHTEAPTPYRAFHWFALQQTR